VTFPNAGPGRKSNAGTREYVPAVQWKMIRATVVGVAVAAFLVGCGGPGHALQLPRDPYLGLRCHNPRVLRCGRVGLAVWLARPA
jgi:hypothetical protein